MLDQLLIDFDAFLIEIDALVIVHASVLIDFVYVFGELLPWQPATAAIYPANPRPMYSSDRNRR